MKRNIFLGLASHADLNHNLSLLCKLDCISHQVENDLPKPQRIAEQILRHIGMDVTSKLQPLFFRTKTERFQRNVKRIAQFEMNGIQIQFSRLDFREVQNVVDHLQ